MFVGSFLGVVVDRLYRGEQFIRGRSHCDFCNHELSVYDLIPVFSFLSNNGKCRYCKKKLSPTLLFFELFTGLTFTAFAYYSFLLWLPLISIIFGFLILLFLLIIFFADLKYSVIFNYSYIILFGFYAVGFLLYSVGINFGAFNIIFMDLASHLISAVWLFSFFALLYYGSKKKAMGDGDMYLAGALGLYLNFSQSLVMWSVAFLTGAFVGVILLLGKKKKIKQAIPFGPFLVIGFVFAFVYGSSVVASYLQLLGN